MMTESIIVYRNPLEKAMWEGTSDFSFFPIMIGVVVFFIAFLALNKVLNNLFPRLMWSKKIYSNANVALTVATLIAGFTVYTLWI